MSTERGGWYDSVTREPRYFVENKSKGGLRASDKRDAIKAGYTWVPGVTSILNVLAKEGLVKYRINESVKAVVTAPDIPGEGLDAKIERVLNVERQQDEEKDEAAKRGIEIHEALEALAKGKTIAEIEDARKILLLDPIGPWIMPAWEHLMSFNGLRVAATEFVVIGKGYGGRVDLLLQSKTTATAHFQYVDFKTTKKLPDKGSYTEARLQLAAYAKTFGNSYPIVTTANLYISTTEVGKFAYFDNGDWTKDYECFEHLVAVWQHINNYHPVQP